MNLALGIEGGGNIDEVIDGDHEGSPLPWQEDKVELLHEGVKSKDGGLDILVAHTSNLSIVLEAVSEAQDGSKEWGVDALVLLNCALSWDHETLSESPVVNIESGLIITSVEIEWDHLSKLVTVSIEESLSVSLSEWDTRSLSSFDNGVNNLCTSFLSLLNHQVHL